MESSGESGEEDEDVDDEKPQKPKLYVPLKLRAMYYGEWPTTI